MLPKHMLNLPTDLESVDLLEVIKALKEVQETILEQEGVEKIAPLIKDLNQTYMTYQQAEAEVAPTKPKGFIKRRVAALLDWLAERLGVVSKRSWEKQVEFNAKLVELLNHTTIPDRKIQIHQMIYNERLFPYLRGVIYELHQTRSLMEFLDRRLEDTGEAIRQVERFYRRFEELYNQRLQDTADWIPKFQDQLSQNIDWLRNYNEQLEQFRQKQADVMEHHKAYRRKLYEIADSLKGTRDIAGKVNLMERFRENLIDEEYFLFENKYRGSLEEIKERQKMYLPFFEGKENVVDIGCGRGEFLGLLKDAGIDAWGLDSNREMVKFCKQQGLNVKLGDFWAVLESVKAETLGGATAFHFVEHFPGTLIKKLVQQIYFKLKSDSPFIIETQNITSVYSMAKSFWLDMDHVTPVHPLAMRDLFEEAGFRKIEVKYLNEVPDYLKLKSLEKVDLDKEITKVVNENTNKLNELLYNAQDFAVIGYK